MELKLWENEIPHFNPDADTPNRMTVYLAKNDKPAPCVVIFPGGGYSHRAFHEGEPVAQFFNSKGINAVVVDYRVAPNRANATLSDAQRAIKLVRAHADEWNVDPDRVVTLGFSAGGHLCASTLVLDDISDEGHSPDKIDKFSARPNGGILCYALISFEEEWWHPACGRNFLGEKYNSDYEFYSLHHRVSSNTPPCFIWHTSDDDCVNVKNSLIFAEKLRDNNVKFEMHIYPSGRHGLGLAQQCTDIGAWSVLAADWIWKNV